MQQDRQRKRLRHTVGTQKKMSKGRSGERPSHLPVWCLPFIICKLVSVVVGGDNVHEKNVLRFGVKASHLHFVTGEHPSRRGKERGEGGGGWRIKADILKNVSVHVHGRSESPRNAGERPPLHPCGDPPQVSLGLMGRGKATVSISQENRNPEARAPREQVLQTACEGPSFRLLLNARFRVRRLLFYWGWGRQEEAS